MSTRLSHVKLEDGAARSVSLPLVLRDGALELGQRAQDPLFASVETVRMPDAFDALEALEPQLQECLRPLAASSSARSMLVAARVGADGRTSCALTSSAHVLPANVGDCTSAVLRGARFPPPKRGSGIVLIPLLVLGSRSKQVLHRVRDSLRLEHER